MKLPKKVIDSKDITENLKYLIIPVINFIKYSQDYVKSSVIERKFNIKGAQVRIIINTARAEIHAPIISGKKGYFYDEEKKAIQRQIDSLKSRINKMEKAIQGLQKLI